MNVREFKTHSLIWPVLFLILGIMAAFYDITSRVKLTTLLIFGLIILWAFIWHSINERTHFSLLSIFCFFLFFVTGWSLTTFQKNQYIRYEKELSENGHPSGTIVDISQFSKMTRIQIRLSSKNWWNSSHYFNINLLQKNHPFHIGQVIAIAQPLNQIVSSKNPFTFQAKEYWRTQNTSHEIFLYDTSEIQLIRDNSMSVIEKIRRHTTHRMDELYPEPTQAGLLKALLLGRKEGISKAQKEDFKRAGLMHILAVSGLHVGIISALLFVILLPVKLLFTRSWIHTALVLIILWIYAALTGLNTPVVRAVILATFYLTASRIDRKIDKWNIYFWAVLLVLIIYPTSLFTISFQLSFGAVASILLFYKKYHEWITTFIGHHYFSDMVAVSLAAQTGIFPLLVYHFQEFSFVGTLSSFLVIPLLFPLILMTSASLIIPDSLSFFSVGFSKISQSILELITDLSNALAGWNVSSLVWVWSTYTIGFIFLAILLAGLYLESKKMNTHRWMIYGSLSCLLLGGLSEGLKIYHARNQPTVAVYEIGDHPITDLYFRGVCYTNFQETPPPFLIRNRKNHYAATTIFMPDNIYWETLISTISNKYLNANVKGDDMIQIHNYSGFRDYFVQLAQPRDKLHKEKSHFHLPLLTSNSPE